MHQENQSDPKSDGYTSTSNGHSWNNAMQDSSPYCGYPPNYWYPPPAGPYTNAYPSGTEINGQAAYNPQAMPAYPNGVYNPGQYPPNVLHPSNPFYCSDQIPPRQPQYHSQERTTASSPQPPYPVPHCQGAPGFPPSSYSPYGDGCPPNAPYPAQQPVPSRSQPEPWPHSAGYGPQAHYPNHTRPPHPPPWHGPAPPPYDHIKHKEPPYPGHLSNRNRPGTPNSNPAPNPAPNKQVEFSAPPQIYNKTSSGGANQPNPDPAPAAPQPPSSENSGLARVQEVLARVHLLQEDVDEFVGKKTDKSYRCLEELLTKELLVLDSVETNGQDAVRSARKEAVQKIQAILDRLENKAF
ncbi:BAG family molecular chaperone regulator 4 isoform X1 [Ictalurus furcatus]|uniref:BAG family molecular chaperone regulator 4 isoform X1 n=1 Tax=Ictalurus furcatus TaxID=66913 RepID=UPI00234FC65F|nr:BAG family molecular chaperone regulator 4 isoform X1 [Ictalurus furcatus]